MTMRAWLVVIGVGLVAGPARAATIDPSTLVGSWSGTWENRSFTPHPTGTVTATVAAPDANTVVVTYSATGGVFGQCTVMPTTLTLVKGVDFTDTTLSFTRQDPTFGNVIVKSKNKGRKLTGRGTGTCGGGGPSWNATARYKAPNFAAKMKIKLPGKLAKTTIRLAKQ
jgi:hypothetical protein